jgi:hypothetical protein
MGILGASPQTVDADDSTFAHGPERESVDLLSSVQGKQTPSDSLEQAVGMTSVLSSSHGPEVQGKETPPSESPEQDQTPPDSPEEATNIVNTSDHVKADNIRVLFRALPEILQYLIDATTVAHDHWQYCDVQTIIATLVVATILCIVFYDLYLYTLQDIDSIILVQ